MFLGSSMKAAYIKGEKNTIVDYLSNLHQQDNFSQFHYTSLVAEKLPLFSPECQAALAVLLVSTSLLTGSVSIPTVRLMLGQMLAV
jgi:hypothetical protein